MCAVNKVGSIIAATYQVKEVKEEQGRDPGDHKCVLVCDLLSLLSHGFKLFLREVDEESCE